MAHQFSTLTFTDNVRAVQREMGSRPANEKLTERGPANDSFTDDEKSFIAARDSFYIATVGETGWPYIQFRGGPTGFLRVLDDHTLAYADVTGNRQYITTGNLRTSDKAALFLMDYPHQTRLKILGHVEIVPWNEAGNWKLQLSIPERARPERAVRIHLAAFDWNCPQHIPQRWTIEELQHTALFERIGSLEQEVKTLRAKLSAASIVKTEL
ncbi:MAG: pyridoxamine 5-phosphate oxidase-related FMN-binding [Acidobacteriaceae bacterium]|nr:pyridoxamine 5-phosphate oxidase-related FMN-binding [Acidobacteriaceae bacterium]